MKHTQHRGKRARRQAFAARMKSFRRALAYRSFLLASRYDELADTKG